MSGADSTKATGGLKSKLTGWWPRGVEMAWFSTGVVVAGCITVWVFATEADTRALQAMEFMEPAALAEAISGRPFSVGTMMPVEGGILASVIVERFDREALCRLSVEGVLSSCFWIGSS